MDLSAKKLTLIFTLAAGVTCGGIVGVGTVYHEYGGMKTETVHRAHGKANPADTRVNPAKDTGTGVEAEILKIESGQMIVRAHTWVGQFAITSICANDNAQANPACEYSADITDEQGKKITNPQKGQTVWLRKIEGADLKNLFAGIPNIRPTGDVLAGPVKAHVVKSVDGDTAGVLAEIWPGNYVVINVRFNGIDTPEKGGRAKCPAEAALAEKASAATKELIDNKDVMLYNVQYEKFGGRLLADVYTLDGKSASQNLIDKGLARPYHGEKKQSWCK